MSETQGQAMEWAPNLGKAAGPIYLALADAIGRGIADGGLAPGEKLPSQRNLARRLGVDLTTVTRAYAEAARRGLIASEDRRGSFVRAVADAPVADTAEEEAASGMNMPPEPEGGLLRAVIADGVRALLDGPESAPLHYRPRGGSEADRAAGAAFLARLIPDTSPDQMAVAAGAQNALHAVCGLLLRPGDRLAAGAFTYPGLLAVARRIGVDVVPLAMDEDGILPDALETAARGGALKAVYLVPTNDNPTTATLPGERRAAIADIARRHGLAIVEDDPYGHLPETPPAPVAALAPERTWHIASLSKAVSPALRVAWLRAPSVRDALALAADLHETAVMPPPLNLALARRWIGDGTMARLIGAVRAEAGARQWIAREILGPAGRGRSDGYHVWLPLDAPPPATPGLPVVPGASFAVDGHGPHAALRVSLGGGRTRDRLRRDLARLDALIAGAGRRDHALV